MSSQRVRDYEKEYKDYQGLPAQKKARALRNKNRREAEREGKVHKGDGLEVHHKNKRVTDNSKKNLSVVTKKYNRVNQ